MGAAYPELVAGRDAVVQVVRSEEERFDAVLTGGLASRARGDARSRPPVGQRGRLATRRSSSTTPTACRATSSRTSTASAAACASTPRASRRRSGRQREQARAKSAFDGGTQGRARRPRRRAALARRDRRVPRLRRRSTARRRRSLALLDASLTAGRHACRPAPSGFVVLGPDAVLPRSRRPGLRHRRAGRTPSGAATPVVDVVRLGPGLPRAHRVHGAAAPLDPRRPGHAARRRRPPGGDPPQPHRHAPAPRGAARDAGRRTSSRPARWSLPIGCASTSSTPPRSPPSERQRIERIGQRGDPRQRAGAHRGQGHAAGDRRRRHRALRREVRRPGAGRVDRRRALQHRAVRRHPRRGHRRHRPAGAHRGIGRRGRGAPRRGADRRPAPWPTCAARSTTCTAPRRPPTPPPAELAARIEAQAAALAKAQREIRELKTKLAMGGGAAAGRRRRRLDGGRLHAWSSGGWTASTARRCGRWPTPPSRRSPTAWSSWPATPARAG